MIEFFATNWATILVSIITAGLLAAFGFVWKRMKQYKSLLDSQKEKETEDMIDTKLAPIYQELEDLRKYINETKQIETAHLNLIIASYKYRLVQLCTIYLKQTYMTQEQYSQLLEFYKVYTGLGGNGEAKEYFDKVSALPVHS